MREERDTNKKKMFFFNNFLLQQTAKDGSLLQLVCKKNLTIVPLIKLDFEVLRAKIIFFAIIQSPL